jgi:hypothetical protein
MALQAKAEPEQIVEIETRLAFAFVPCCRRRTLLWVALFCWLVATVTSGSDP